MPAHQQDDDNSALPLTLRERATYAALSAVFRQDVARAAMDMRSRAFWSIDRMEAFRLQRAKALLAHATAHVPHYRRAFTDAGFDPGDISSLADLRRLPVLTREDLVTNFSELRAENVPDDAVARRSTGGTSGQPVTVLLENRCALERMLVTHRMYTLMGRTLGTPTLLIAGSPIDAATWNTVVERVKSAVWGTRVISSFSLTPDRVAAIVAEIRRGPFRFVVAYASVFDILARYVRETGQRLHIPAVIPAAELVTESQRALWSDTFGCEIFEMYGSREMSTLAAEVGDHRRMMITGDLYYFEVLDDGGAPVPAGTPGLLTITNLAEHAMPLIRYQLGDMGALHPPPPGSPHPFERLSITHGRVLDVIVCADGKLLPGEYFPHLMKEVQAEVRQFQVVQSALDSLVVRVVRTTKWRDETERYLRQRIHQQVGAMRIEFELVEAIPTSPSGKYRPTISLVPASQKRVGNS